MALMMRSRHLVELPGRPVPPVETLPPTRLKPPGRLPRRAPQASTTDGAGRSPTRAPAGEDLQQIIDADVSVPIDVCGLGGRGFGGAPEGED